MPLTSLAREQGDKPAAAPVSVGKPILGEVHICSDDGDELPSGKMLRRLLMDRYRSLPSS